MSIGGFILKNTLRNKRRALLCMLSTAVSLFLLVALQVALREMTNPPSDAGASLRIAVRNKVSIAQPLPARQRPVLERIPGVEAVTPLTFFGGKFKDDESLGFAQFAIDPEQLTAIFGEAKVNAQEFENWKKDRTSALVGADTARKYNLRVGDRVTIVGQIYPFDLELTIAGVYSGSIDDRSLFFHHRYFDELLGNTGEVGMWWIKAASPEEVPDVIERVNAAFANTSAEVLAETERAFQLGFVSMWGNIRLFITSICSVVVFTLVLVTASTMSMAVRERFRELAILKALGFRRREVWVFILAESFGLAMAGALLGAGGAWALFTFGDVQSLTGDVFLYFEVTPGILGIAFSVAAGLGIIGSLAPAFAIMRTTVVQGLRTLD